MDGYIPWKSELILAIIILRWSDSLQIGQDITLMLCYGDLNVLAWG